MRHNPITLLVLLWLSSPGQAIDTVYKVPDEELFKHEPGRATIHSAHSGFNAPVFVRVVVDRQGNVVSARAFDGPARAFREAEAAEKQLKFKPFIRNGRPVHASFVDDVSVYPLERWSKPRLPFPPIRNWSSMHLTMERLAYCSEPRCTAYVLQVRADRTVHLAESRWRFSHPVQFTGTMSPEDYKTMLDEFRQADFFSMLDRYTVNMTDGAGTKISISFDGWEKTVLEYDGILDGAPDSLRHLADRIDQLTGAQNWLKHQP